MRGAIILSIALVFIFLSAIIGAALISGDHVGSQGGISITVTGTSVASDGINFYASYAPKEVISALNNLTSSTSTMTLPHGSDIYTRTGYFEETFPNATGAISGTYESNAMLIQIYYDNITFNIAVRGSNGLSYGIPVSNTSVVYFIPHHINETSEMTLVMFYVGVHYYLVHHQPLYRNVNEGTLGISASENAETYGNVAGGGFVPYIVCCHPGDCACSGSGDQSWSGSSCKWYNNDSYDCEKIDTFQISATICYDSSGVITGVLNTQTCVQDLIEGPGCDGEPADYVYDSGNFLVQDTKGFSYTSSIDSGTNCYPINYVDQDTTITGTIHLCWVGPCCDLEGANGQVSLNVPQLS